MRVGVLASDESGRCSSVRGQCAARSQRASVLTGARVWRAKTRLLAVAGRRRVVLTVGVVLLRTRRRRLLLAARRRSRRAAALGAGRASCFVVRRLLLLIVVSELEILVFGIGTGYGLRGLTLVVVDILFGRLGNRDAVRLCQRLTRLHELPANQQREVCTRRQSTLAESCTRCVGESRSSGLCLCSRATCGTPRRHPRSRCC